MTEKPVREPRLSEDYMIFEDRAYIKLKGQWLLLSDKVRYFGTNYMNGVYRFILKKEDGVIHEFDLRKTKDAPYLFEEVRYTDWKKEYYEISLQSLIDYTNKQSEMSLYAKDDLEKLYDADKVKLASVNPYAKKVCC